MTVLYLSQFSSKWHALGCIKTSKKMTFRWSTYIYIMPNIDHRLQPAITILYATFKWYILGVEFRHLMVRRFNLIKHYLVWWLVSWPPDMWWTESHAMIVSQQVMTSYDIIYHVTYFMIWLIPSHTIDRNWDM